MPCVNNDILLQLLRIAHRNCSCTKISGVSYSVTLLSQSVNNVIQSF